MGRECRVSREDWEVLQKFFPKGWKIKAKELGAVRRARKLDAESLLRVLLMHLADGSSLRETAARARVGKIADISDVGVLKRLRGSGEWLRWMAHGVMESCVSKRPDKIFGGHGIRLIDGTTVQEPGSTGSDWRIHYSVDLSNLFCSEVYVTEPSEGETFKRFTVEPGDVLMGDRGYAHPGGISYVTGCGGNVIVRTNLTNVPLEDTRRKRVDLLKYLRSLSGTHLGDWDVRVLDKSKRVFGRICAIAKSKEAAEKARKIILRAARKKGRIVQPNTLEAAGYIFVFTTLRREDFTAGTVLEMYRGRWQIELAFKRLKSIMSLGHLRKTDPQGARAWIHGKLLVAFLIEALIVAGESFFPWGYPLCYQDPM